MLVTLSLSLSLRMQVQYVIKLSACASSHAFKTEQPPFLLCFEHNDTNQFRNGWVFLLESSNSPMLLKGEKNPLSRACPVANNREMWARNKTDGGPLWRLSPCRFLPPVTTIGLPQANNWYQRVKRIVKHFHWRYTDLVVQALTPLVVEEKWRHLDRATAACGGRVRSSTDSQQQATVASLCSAASIVRAELVCVGGNRRRVPLCTVISSFALVVWSGWAKPHIGSTRASTSPADKEEVVRRKAASSCTHMYFTSRVRCARTVSVRFMPAWVLALC